MELKDWLSLVALFLSAIVAVLISQYLQDRKSKKDKIYQNKLNVFTTILGYRHAKGSEPIFVVAMNQIPIVFYDNKSVISKLNRFISEHQDVKPKGKNDSTSLTGFLNDLVIEMAKDIGYHDADNSMMNSFFFPESESLRLDADWAWNKERTSSYYQKNSQSHKQYNEENQNNQEEESSQP